MNKLYGKADYYSMDPFHEGGSVAGVDLDAAGKAIMQAMKKNNPKAVWVAQAWQANPRPQMIGNLEAGDLITAIRRLLCSASIYLVPEGRVRTA